MGSDLYVATDSKGVEHSSRGRIEWVLPSNGRFTDINPGQTLTLRRPIALLDVLDERIFRAESSQAREVDSRGTVDVTTGRLVAETKWNTELATRFALDCAEHLLEQFGDIALPNGASLRTIIADARNVLDGVSSQEAHRLDYLARIRALRRLKHERGDVADQSLTDLTEDESKDVDALDDPEYEALAPITDAVLAAIEALRHHVLPHLYTDVEDAREERGEHRLLDRTTELPVPTAVVTPFGEGEVGAPHVLKYEPAWTSARDAARHAREAVKGRLGSKGESEELTWQAGNLERVLSS